MTPEEIISMITDRVKDTANVRVVFGDPVETGGVTIIPVATVKVAGGGGGGKGRAVSVPLEGEEAQTEGGVGMGLQINTRPLGYIQMSDGAARWVPIVDVNRVAIVSMITGGLVAMTLAKLAWRRAKLNHQSA